MIFNLKWIFGYLDLYKSLHNYKNSLTNEGMLLFKEIIIKKYCYILTDIVLILYENDRNR